MTRHGLPDPFAGPWKGVGRKLTDTQAAIVKRELAKGTSLGVLAAQFGVSRSSIRNIKYGLAYAGVQPAPEEEGE